MKSFILHFIIWIFIFIPDTAFVAPQTPSGVIIVNNSNPSAELSASQAKLLYTRKIKRLWPNNKPIKPVSFKGKTALQTSFYSKVLSMTQEEVDAYFKQRQFANSETLPTEVSSEKDMVEFVADNEGAIGFVSASYADANKDKVKVLFKF